MDGMKKVSTDGAPAAIGPYSQAIVCEGWIHVSGQIALDPRSGRFEEGSTADQTHAVLRNLSAILEAAGGGLDTVVRTTVYLIDMGTFSEMNEVYREHFGDHRPARSTVGVAALPKGAVVEIDALARLKG